MRTNESGFTLVEALVAILVLVCGLIAVSNLMLVASTSTSVANQSTAATVVGSRIMENLNMTAWTNLVVGGSLTADVPGAGPDCDAITAADYNCDSFFPGVGTVHARWTISVPAAGAIRTLFIQVQAEGTGPLAGPRSRATFNMFRACTEVPPPAGVPGCPAGGGGL